MRKAFIQLHIAIVLAGFTAILGKLIDLNEGYLVWYRMLISAVTLAIIIFFSKDSFRIPFKKVMQFLGIGGIIAMHWVTFYGSIKYSNISVSVTCLSAIGFFPSLAQSVSRSKSIK